MAKPKPGRRGAAGRKKAQAGKAHPAKADDAPLFGGYRPIPGTRDEMFDGDGAPWASTQRIADALDGIGAAGYAARQRLADNAFLHGGVTFSVYSDKRGVEKVFPFDLIPRVVAGEDWDALDRGLVQRVQALNAFLTDVYGDQRILDEGVIPRAMVLGSKGYRPQLRGISPPGGVYVHIAGVDLIRDPNGRFLVLEDNARTPSGVSYMLENRSVLKRVLPRIFAMARVRPVDQYPTTLRTALASLAPGDPEQARLVVLTPGQFNSAYFEHGFLARRMGCPLVHPTDLVVHQRRVYMKTTRGPERVDVIYRRIDDDFIDPTVFRADSLLGVPGLVDAYAAGNVVLANALGNGVADDKAIYPFVPDMIRFYLSEEPLLAQVPTLICEREADRALVLESLSSMVVKAVDESGGYGMLMGPSATVAERAEFADRIRANPRGYIAQPRIELSTCPTWAGSGPAPRRVDLRPYVVTGTSTSVIPGGLTRVAIRKGSYVVNSSQGGGSKDTWVLETEDPS